MNKIKLSEDDINYLHVYKEMCERGKKISGLEDKLKEVIEKNNNLIKSMAVLLDFINNINKNFADAQVALSKIND